MIKRLILHGCAYYTCLSAVLLFIGLVSGETSGLAVEPIWFFRILGYSMLLSLSGLFRKEWSIPGWVRILCHALCVAGGFYLILFLPFGIVRKYAPFTFFAVFLVTLFVYGTGLLIYHFVLNNDKHRSSPGDSEKTGAKKESKYQNQFKK